MKLISKYGISLVLLLFVAVGIYYYISKDGKRDIKYEKPKYILDPSRLYNDFIINMDSSNVKYHGQVIQLTGKVVRIAFGEKGAFICFMFQAGGVTCAFDKKAAKDNYERLSKIKVGDQVTLKGKFERFDDYWGVILTGCYY
jgi:hypothetical protein